MTEDRSLEAFRDEVRAFIRESATEDIREAGRKTTSVFAPFKQAMAWQRILADKGWVAPSWPQEYGGTGWSLEQRYVFAQECNRAQMPPILPQNLQMVGPAILGFGSDAQKAELLPRMLSGEDFWCQGYSEPGAGSDLAALKCRADRDGDDYILNGSKIWTSGAELADWIFCLVRTNPDVQQQKGISFLLFDMTSPGVTVKPLYAFNGKRLWNQVFFEDVRVPVSQRLGDEDRGWTVAKSLLGDERLMVSRVAENRRILANLRETLEHQLSRSSSALDATRRAINELDIRLQALEATSLRILTAFDGGGDIGAEPSMLKLKGSELVQAQDEVLFTMIDYLALPLDTATGGAAVTPDWAEYIASGRYHHRGFTIAGGSYEVQHNIIAKQVLGL